MQSYFSGKRPILIITLVACSILLVSCTGITAPATIAPPASTPTVQVTTTKTITVTPPPVTVTLTVTPSPTPPTTVTQAVPGSTFPAETRFFTRKEITGYTTSTPRLDGSYDKFPVYQDVYYPLEELYRFSTKDAIFVPHIPTITSHDDWFFRFNIPANILNTWVINWGYAFQPGSEPATMDFSIFPKAQFEANYYKSPLALNSMEIRPEDELKSETGIFCKLMYSPGDYVILFRTSRAESVAGWWVRIGVE